MSGPLAEPSSQCLPRPPLSVFALIGRRTLAAIPAAVPVPDAGCP